MSDLARFSDRCDAFVNRGQLPGTFKELPILPNTPEREDAGHVPTVKRVLQALLADISLPPVHLGWQKTSYRQGSEVDC